MLNIISPQTEPYLGNLIDSNIDDSETCLWLFSGVVRKEIGTVLVSSYSSSQVADFLEVPTSTDSILVHIDNTKKVIIQ